MCGKPAPSHLSAAPGVVQPGEKVLVSGLLSGSLGKVPGQPEPSLAEILLQSQAAAGRHEILAPAVTATDGSHSPLVDPGQVPLLLLGQSTTTGLQYSKW